MANKMKTHVKWSPMDFPDRIKNHPEKLKEARLGMMTKAKDMVAQRAVSNIDSMGSNYTREAVRSISGEQGSNSLTEATDKHAIVGSHSISAIILEHGRSPGRRAPVSAIAPWAATKGITNRRAIYLISQAIAIRGIRPRRPIYRALKAAENKFTGIAMDAADKFLNALGFH